MQEFLHGWRDYWSPGRKGKWHAASSLGPIELLWRCTMWRNLRDLGDGSPYKKSSSSAESLPAGYCSAEHSPMSSTATYSSAPSNLGTRRPVTRRYVRSREPRLRWTQDLHQSFVRAIGQLGGHESEHGSMHPIQRLPFALWFVWQNGALHFPSVLEIQGWRPLFSVLLKIGNVGTILFTNDIVYRDPPLFAWINLPAAGTTSAYFSGVIILNCMNTGFHDLLWQNSIFCTTFSFQLGGESFMWKVSVVLLDPEILGAICDQQ